MARPGSHCELGGGILLDDKQETFLWNETKLSNLFPLEIQKSE